MKKYLNICLLAVLLLFCFSSSGCGWLEKKQVTTTITSTQVKRSTGDTSEDKYLVFTSSAGVFENTDTFWFWKYNSSDVQNTVLAKEESGEPVKLTYYWTRSNFFSWYPNILKVE